MRSVDSSWNPSTIRFMSFEPTTRPHFSPAQAIRITEEHFGVTAAAARSLPSDRDQNFLLREEESGRKYVLKLSKSDEDPEVLDFQNRMLEHLARAGFELSRVFPSKDRREVVAIPGPGEDVYLTRLLSWVPGTQLSLVRPQRPLLLESLGTFLGGMDRALEDFTHPAQNRELKWDLKHAREVIREHSPYVEEPGRQDLLHRLSERFLAQLGPLVPELRVSVIHADANDHNVLVADMTPGTDPDLRRVSGLVDFGDAVRSYTVGEAAIAGAYAMLEAGDPLGVASHIVRGYNRALPLRDAEVEALLPLMGMRLCISVAISAHQKQREPDNGYLTVSEAPAWELLEKLDGEIPGLPTKLFREACGLDTVPSSRSIVAWLREHGHQASPVVASSSDPGPDLEGITLQPLDLAAQAVHVFDLQWDSMDFCMAPPLEDAEAWTGLVRRRMEDAGATVGIGRYDEVRQIYGSELFRAPGDDPPEWRTVHLGIDVFLDAGSPVLAPFDAVVHSVANNAGFQDYGPTVVLEHRAPLSGGEEGKFWTLFGHLGEECLAQLYPGRPVAKGEAFARIGDFPVNGNWVPHLHFQIITDLLGLEGNFPGVARPSQRDLWKALSPDPNLIAKVPDRAALSSRSDSHCGPAAPGRPPRGSAAPGQPSGVPMNTGQGHTVDEILEARRRHLGPTLSIAYRAPLKIVRGSGQFLYDHQGQAYLDCVNNVPHVGHCHPRVVAAGQQQMAVLNTNTRYLHDLLVDYAQRLTATLPDPLSVVYFVCSGSEANELALRMARTHTGRRDVVVVDGAYHGNTSALVDMSPYKFDGAGGEGAKPWVHKTLLPDPYRGRFRAVDTEPEDRASPPRGDDPDPFEYLPPDELGARYAGQVLEVLERMGREGRLPAAFFCEPLLGCGGQIVPPAGYMAEVFEHVRRAGGLCVADEVQVGFGRVGSHFWAFESQGVIPDIVTLGKPMANGHPMAAVVTTPTVAESFVTGMEYFNTFGGNPVSCAIGMAVMDVIEEEGLQENALRVGNRLLDGLTELKDRHGLIGDVRGMGLYLGVELVEDRATRTPAPDKAARVKERLREHHLLLSTDGPADNVLKIKPPLVFSLDDAVRLVSTLDKILGEDGLQV